ncbi:MAG TPA: dethiobiotin synthase [Phenylobacterium sp.]|uniref:dethiobiotin synthase n=1 Tax=Phenylobacterium sp. TaxID=1871053 RepID=UPI002D10AC7B|nr:dethiobiotin synthase [Phenylobacterium sp.]HXA37849.1 dethiobiotin synthase [Phenylobacterium sp.]
MTGSAAPRILFVLGAHTEIGKTHVACGLLRAAREAGLTVDALKPVVSGFAAGDWSDSDPGRLLAAMGRPLVEEELERLAPWRLVAPLAPPMAAQAEGRPLPFADVAAFCQGRIEASRADLMIVEGVGGLMSPLADGATCLDLLEGLGSPSVLVGGAYLGAVSHTLTALEVLRGRGRAPAGIIVSEDADPQAPDFMGTVALVSQHAGQTPVVPAARQGGDGWARLLLQAVRGPAGNPGRR